MNIQNFEPFTPTWTEIFEKQKELKFLYEPEAKELFDNFDIDCFEDQELFKKCCWRITEELTEALEAHFKDGTDHTQEELIDAMNFSIELMLLYGWSSENFLKKRGEAEHVYFGDTFGEEVTEVIYTLGLTANVLKNRQWRRSQYLTDLLIFEKRFITFLNSLYELLRRRYSDKEIRQAWSLKYQVNLFRIQSNY